MRRTLLLMMFAALLLCGVVSAALFGRKSTEAFAEYLDRREQVREALAQQFEALPTGFKLQARDNPRDALLHKSFLESNAQIRRNLARTNQTGLQGCGQFQWFVTLDPDAQPQNQQNSSDTMASTILLNHLGSGLAQLGFRNQGSPTVAMSALQRSANIWFRENDPSIEIEINVITASNDKQGLVWITIREAYPQQ